MTPNPTLRVVVTGGGSSGHVTPALAVIEVGQERGWHVDYVGSDNGIERDLATAAGLPYFSVPTGKLRRYASFRNLVDPFRVVAGIGKATLLLRKLRPDVVFSTGGFVSFPVVVAAKLNGVPVVAHESDTSPGLANRLSSPFVQVMCVADADAIAHLRRGTQSVVTGTPLRRALFEGNRTRGLANFGLDESKTTLLVFGGSLGARTINAAVRGLLPTLNEHLQVIHVCGAGNLDASLDGLPRYRQYEYLRDEFPDALACADLVVCRAGANSIAEVVSLGLPAILVPLSASQSRGDQLENAAKFERAGLGWTLPDEQLNAESLAAAVQVGLRERETVVAAMEGTAQSTASTRIAEIIESVAGAASP